MKPTQRLAGFLLAAMFLSASAARAEAPAWSWYEVDADRNVQVNLYLFWSSSCPPLCERAAVHGLAQAALPLGESDHL
jgi:hypothetical protein